MSFETFPLPGPASNPDKVDGNLAAQREKLLAVVSKLYEAVDARLGNQGAVLARVSNKLSRAVNGRLKQQQAALAPVAAKLYQAVDDRLSNQAGQIALQSAVLSRIGQPPVTQPQTPTMPVGSSMYGFPSGVGGGGAPVLPTVPSQTPGALPPIFLPQPNPILPQPQPPPSVVSPQSLGGILWGALVDCDAKTLNVYDLSLTTTQDMVLYGAFVPIRYFGEAANRPLLAWDETYRLNSAYIPQWIATACHARDTNGDGWPLHGDFVGNPDSLWVGGIPVGDWPFDKYGRYIGL